MKQLYKFLMTFLLSTQAMALSSDSYVANAQEMLWLMDGSQLTFVDTIKLNVGVPNSLPRYTYEGAFEELKVGTLTLNDEFFKRSFFSAEAEWAISAITEFTLDIDESTPVILQGMIEGKYFAEFFKDQTHWLPASGHNNVLGEGKGILTTVGEIIKGHINAQVNVEYTDNLGRLQNFQSNAQALKDMPLVDIILDVVRNKPQNSVLKTINLGIHGKNAGFVNNERLRSYAIFKTIFEGILPGDAFNQRVLYYLTEKVIAENMYANSDVTLTVFDQNRDQIGYAQILR